MPEFLPVEERAWNRSFLVELLEAVLELLPEGGRVLETGSRGCAALEIAGSGKFEVTVIENSLEALGDARRLFAYHRIPAGFLHQDPAAPGQAEFDLVIHSAVFQHTSRRPRLALLEGLRTRSRKWILELRANPACYLYSLWRTRRHPGEPDCLAGPCSIPEEVSEASRILSAGKSYFGREWSEAFIHDTRELPASFAEDLIVVHRSPGVDPAHAALVVGALGSVARVTCIPARWKGVSGPPGTAFGILDEKATDIRQLSARLATIEDAYHVTSAELASKTNQLNAILNSLSWRAMRRIGRWIDPVYVPLYRHWNAFRNRKSPQLLAAPVPDDLPAEFIAAGSAFDVICLPVIDWDFRFQRPQQIMSLFAAAGHRVFYVACGFRAAGPAYVVTGKIPEVYEVSLRGPERNPYRDALDVEACENLFDGLKQLISRYALGATAVIVQLPFWRPLAERLRAYLAAPLIYDCCDYHAGFDSNTDAMVSEEPALLRTADLVVTSSAFLEAEARSHNANVAVIRNGCDFDHFAPARFSHDSAARSRLLIGYYGAIASWFDSELVAALAEKRGDWDFLLIGSTWSGDVSRLEPLSNVETPGEVFYAHLPGYLRRFDVALLPFRRGPLTEATNPVKAYEILAAGKPLVSVPLPEMRLMAGHVQLASTVEEFEAAIERSLAEPPGAAEARVAFAAANTWQNRFTAFEGAVTEAFPKLSIVIVTYNNRDLNRLCLESVFERTGWPNYEVIVVDNGSTDGTPELLEELELRHPELSVICNGGNLGFAAANNIGIDRATGEYIILLNNDTVVTCGWAAALIRHLCADERLGMAGPVTNAIANSAQVETAYASVDEMPRWAARYTRENRGRLEPMGMLAMFCVALRRGVWNEIGPLDERFGVGMFEDDDYSHRLKQAGYKLRCAHDSFVHHWQRSSFKLLGEERYLEIFHENKRLFEAKWGAQAAPAPGRATPSDSGPGRVVHFRTVQERIRGSRGAVVFPESIGWYIPLFQRPQHLARELARAGYSVIFDNNGTGEAVSGFREIADNLFLYAGPRQTLRQIRDPLLWTFPYNFHLARDFGSGARIVYDWIDHLSVFPQEHGMLQRNHTQALRTAAIVTAVARWLHREAQLQRPDAIYLPNAVEYDHFAGPQDRPHDPEIGKLLLERKPIAGYYGALARWLDCDLLLATARLRPDWNFLLIGHVLDEGVQRHELFRQSNVHWIGTRPYAVLPGYLAVFDAALIPFRSGQIANGTSPLKLFEYLAGGKPVLSSPMPECAAVPEVAVVGNAEELSHALDQALRNGKDQNFRMRCQSWASENSWHARVQTVLELDSRRTSRDPLVQTAF